ncbi:uncharacterized protein Z520_07279 [Fonsecaea multimorphosa CBS 102226]|uniref:Allergen n=1 Tax=Fonsecaea multimorphosa CBS 102226 TaxID=1442371 RepID=A0A0D2H5N5_9EURO|nr:uncharacterized protein Z520_07279 [Fonsecaea multimorphosa CBS 102226]KIX97165.1 hypothetical protein Z520_07279 [Fonsecaea multimorphosa CBS 102226]OAL22940.1 hypothetical protein AYO22_06848 [Fonsecaea multimorphosa]
MEAARAAVQKITGNRGQHTTVEETVNPAVTHEAIKPHRHEEHTQAVDREVHQHHYHTTVQPLTHTERLPEKHHHNILPVEHREFHHDNEEDTKQKITTELGRFKDHSVTHDTHHTQAAAPTVTGEHVHHHVHETVVPVVHKETIQPEVVHTTVPIHETHHAAAQHHGLSALPMKTLDEFKKVGGVLTGGSHSAHEEYEGAPRPYNDKLSTTFEKLEEKFHGTSSDHTTGKTHRPTDSGVGGVGNDQVNNGSLGTDRHNVAGNGIDVANRHTDGTGNLATTDGTKPSMGDRMNPRTDADRDGKVGVMD